MATPKTVSGPVIDPPQEEFDVPHATGPFSPQERVQVARWIGQGVPRNEIARRTGRGVATISRVAEAEGLTFNRADMMGPALAAQGFDMRRRRQAQQAKIHDRIDEMLEEMAGPGTIYFPDYKNGRSIKVKTDRVTPENKRNLSVSIGIMIDKAIDYERLDAPQEGRQAIIALVDTLRLSVKLEGEKTSGG